MSIRAKILSILICALIMTFVVSALASYHASELDSQIGRMLTRNYPIARSAHIIAQSLVVLGQDERQLLDTGDPVYRTHVDNTFLELDRQMQIGRLPITNSKQAVRWSELSQILNELRQRESELADIVRVEVRLLDGRHRQVHQKSKRMRQELRQLAKATQEHRMRLTMALDDPPEEGPGPLALAKASELATKAVELLDALEALRYSAGQADAFHPRFQEGAIPWRLERLEELLKGMAQLLIDSVHVPALNRVTSELPTLSADMEGLGRQLFDVNRRVLALREQTRTLREQAEQVAHAIERAEWSTIDEQRQELMRRKNTAAALILGFLIVGLVVVGGMAFAVLRSISQVVGQLLQASRQLRRGDLAARVPVTGGDELQELGASFNTMAQYLQSRRMRQDNYNEIVTVLNSSLGMDTIVRASLSEVIERTGSTLGALYLKDNVEPVLQLRGTYAMSGEALHRKTVRVGEGIVGQVARTRKLAVVEPVPLEVFGLDVGGGRPGVLRSLLVLPMIHLEELLGVVLLGSMRGYNEEDVRFIEEVVFQVAVSINNARFYQTIEATATALRENRDELMAQRHELEAVNTKLEQANAQLEEANRVKSEFLANVTHELRTPLNSIIGFTELVSESEQLGDRHQRNLGTVLRNARNLLRLINDLLDISQMEAGKITLVLKAFDLTELIEEVVEMLQPLAAAKKLKLTARAEAGGGGPRMFSDRMRCKQILINLVNNAIKFTDTGGVEVTLELLADEEQVAIHVRDSGIGIRSADLKVIFEKFRQLDGSASRKYGGAGLGLAISIQLCRLLGGDISAASVPGEGSTFTLTLPLQVHPNAPEPMERGPEGELLPESPRSVEGDQGDPEAWPDEDGRPFILLMDDDPLALVNLREGVRDAGLEVKSAFTAKEAADILSTLDPVAVVIGAALPEDDGSTAMAEAWELIKERRMPVLLVWDGEGDVPRYGYPDEPLYGGAIEMTGSKIARVMGRLGRPLQAAEMLEQLSEANVWTQERTAD